MTRRPIGGTPLDRDRGLDPRSAAGWTVEMQRTAERLDPVREPAQARARTGIGTADAVVGDLDVEAVVGPGDPDRDARGGRVLRRVRERLCAEEVGRGLG